MPDDIPITPGTGTTVATDEIAGRHFQRVKNTYGADGTATDVDATHPMPVQIGDTANQANVLAGDTGQNAQVITGARKEVTFTTTTAQAVAATDVSNYRWVSVQITSQGGSSTVTFQGSNDNITWVSVPMVLSTSATTISFAATATGLYVGPCSYRYFRLNVTGIVSGTTAGVVEFFANPASITLTQVTADTELPAAATITDTLANPSTPQTAADNMVFNGATWERARSATAAQATTGTGVPAAGTMGFDGTNWRRTRADASGNLGVTVDTGILLDRIENLEVAIRALLSGAGAQLPDGVGRTRVSVDVFSPPVVLASGTLTSITQFGGLPAQWVVPATMNGGFDTLRRGITVS